MTPGDLDLRLGAQFRTLFEVGSLGTVSDGQLLSRFESGDAAASEAAFTMLVERHGPMVLGVCRWLLADPHLAEDAFQAAFFVLARRSGSVRNRDAVGGWLHRVARRIALRSRGRLDRRKSHERPEVEEIAVHDSDRLQRGELRAVIDEEIDRLGEAQRLPIVLCCLEGQSHEEAAHQLGWPVGTVKSRLARGRRRLQDRLLRRGFAPAVAAAGGMSLLGGEATAAVAPALAEATARAAAAIAVRGLVAGVVPATTLVLVREELGSMIVLKLKLATAVSLTAGGFALLLGFALAPAQGQQGDEPPKGVATKPAPDTPASKSEGPAAAATVKLSAAGKVVDSAGKPVAGATVILREWSLYRKRDRGFEGPEELPDTLAETKTNDEGRFRFQEIPAPEFKKTEGVGESVFPWDLVALAPGYGLSWVQLTPQVQHASITLTLGAEGKLRGRVLEPSGKPVVGAKVRVFGLNPLGKPDFNGVYVENGLNLSWSAFPLGARTDSEGRFTLSGLPLERIASLVVTKPRYKQVFGFAATTDVPQPDALRRTVSEDRVQEVYHRIHTGDFTLTAQTIDHVLTGRVLLKAGGKPVGDAQIECEGKRVKADPDGRFRIEGLTAGPNEVQVASTGFDAAPIAVKFDIPEQPQVFERDLVLPPGLVLTGRVVDDASGKGVAKARITYTPKVESKPPQQSPSGFRVARLESNEDDRDLLVFGLSAETDSDGRYRLVVPAGKGTLSLRLIPSPFEQFIRDPFGRAPTDPKFLREVGGEEGQAVEVADFTLSRTRSVLLRVVDPDGQPVANAQVEVREPNVLPRRPSARTDAQGQYEVTGLQPLQATIIDVISVDRRLGGTIEVPDVESTIDFGTLEVRLQPLVTLTGRVLDDEGKPLAVQVLYLYRSVAYPGQSGRSVGIPVATRKQVNEDGTYKFDQLIPGVSYYTHVEAIGHATSASKHVAIKPGQPAKLDDFRLPVTDQELKGLVVDPRGKPLDKVIVSYERTERTSTLYSPKGTTWSQPTDGAGRFHLTGLPRGPVKLMVYRAPLGSDHVIEHSKSVDVELGRNEVRIELPDPDDRLRGID